MRKELKDKTTPFTPAVSLAMAMKTALDMIKKEGIENVWKRCPPCPCNKRKCEGARS